MENPEAVEPSVQEGFPTDAELARFLTSLMHGE
jgi:hypothetical protein